MLPGVDLNGFDGIDELKDLPSLFIKVCATLLNCAHAQNAQMPTFLSDNVSAADRKARFANRGARKAPAANTTA